MENVLATEQVGVWAPIGRDGELICQALSQTQFRHVRISDVVQLCELIVTGEAAAAIVTEEALTPAHIERLTGVLSQQPPWSDFPLIVLTSGGRPTTPSLRRFRLIETLGHVTLLERPLRSVTLYMAVRAARQSRQRQFQLRDYLAERARAEEELTRQAQELARSNADLQQFAYVTSHDLKEPIRSIHSFAELFVRRYEDGSLEPEDGRQFLSFVVGGAQRMQKLVEDLLSYSRVVNADSVSFGLVALDAVSHWAKANLQRALDDADGEITADPLPNVWGDQVQLVQLFQNLFSNSIKYRHPDRAPRVHVSAERSGEHWTIGFRDNGIGFAPEYAEQIFGIFKRLHGREIPGTGIGLATCRKIAERHQGRIWAESDGVSGAVFRVMLLAEQPQ